jgi:protein phosphatase 1L
MIKSTINFWLFLFVAVNIAVQQDRTVTAPAWGMAEAQGIRATMEDAHCVDIQRNYAIFGLFDGHGGVSVARYAAKNLPDKIRENCAKNAESDLFSLKALKRSFLELHKNIDDKLFNQGCTALVVIIKDGTISVANAGDSRAVMCMAGRARALSNDHKPDRPDEKARIEKLGGYVIKFGVPRVNGILAISRALGDKALNPLVTPEPEVIHTTLTQLDEFLIMACDGVWDVMNNQDAVDIVRGELSKHYDFNKAAAVLKDEALRRGSTDNITVMVIDIGKFH